MVQRKRVYEHPATDDGTRVLVDRLWPRGVRKEDAHIDWWAKALAPSKELRTWFGHDPSRFPEFARRYREEVRYLPDLDRLRGLAAKGTVTLVYGAKDSEHNNARVLAELLAE